MSLFSIKTIRCIRLARHGEYIPAQSFLFCKFSTRATAVETNAAKTIKIAGAHGKFSTDFFDQILCRLLFWGRKSQLALPASAPPNYIHNWQCRQFAADIRG